jgi:hypothetical protein
MTEFLFHGFMNEGISGGGNGQNKGRGWNKGHTRVSDSCDSLSQSLICLYSHDNIIFDSLLSLVTHPFACVTSL